MTRFRLVAALGLAALLATATAWAAAGDRRPFSFPQLPNGGRPETRIPFPAIIDRSTIKIVLDRGACLGTCPNYRVEISADGTVRYDGRGFVAVRGGMQEAHIPVEAVQYLYDDFEKADFFSTLDSYRAPVTDLPTTRVSISFDGTTKTVMDYAGLAIGMPREIVELEAAIDATADTKKWVKGN